MSRAKSSGELAGNFAKVRLSKMEVIRRMAEGLYLEFPEQWVPDATGYVLDEWQKNIIRKLFIGNNPPPGADIFSWYPEKKARLSLRAAHSCGKTFMASILTHFFLCNYLPSRVAITGPTGKQTKSQVWNYIQTVWSRSVFRDDIEMYGTTMKFRESPAEWFATWLTSKEPRSIEGFHGPNDGENLLWIVEESKTVADAVFEAIQGALSNEHCYWYISSTCGSASGFFFDTFHSKQSLWENTKVTYKDSSRISLDQIRKWEQSWGRDSSIFKARALAEFPEEDDKILVPLSWCERAIRQPQNDEDIYDEDIQEAA